jgi:hypothetical protein
MNFYTVLRAKRNKLLAKPVSSGKRKAAGKPRGLPAAFTHFTIG